MAWNGRYFFDLVKTAFGGDAKKLQSFVDAGETIYNKMDLSGFPFASQMQIDPTFEQVSMNYGIQAMATWVDYDSPGTPVTQEAPVLQTGNLPRNKKYAAFTEMDFRRMSRSYVNDLEKFSQQTLLDIHERLINAHNNANTYMRHQMVSNGKFELTESNNASGIKGVVFSASIPDANKITKTSTAVWWASNGTEGTASDPVKDLQALAEKAKGTNFHFEVDALTLKKTLNHSKVIRAVGFNANPMVTDNDVADAIGGNLGLDERKRRLESLIGFPIVEVESVSRIDKFNKKTNKVEGEDIRSFNEKSWALIPNGKIGETLVLAPLMIGDERNFATYHGGRLLLTYEYLSRKKEQIIETEMTALPVPTKPELMYILNIG